MIINPQVLQIFKEYNIPKDDGVLCLLAVYHDLDLSDSVKEALDTTMKQINISHIVERDYENKDVKWNVPLFEGQQTAWDWVLTEYRPMFLSIRKDRGGSPKSCLARMKEFFRTHPEVRKDDILEAVRHYIANLDNADYLQGADYFIKKDAGANATSRLEQYLEIVKTKREATNMRNAKMM